MVLMGGPNLTKRGDKNNANKPKNKQDAGRDKPKIEIVF